MVFHANVGGVRPREEELRAATAGFPVLALQETGFRSVDSAATVWRRSWPDFEVVASFLHDEDGVGTALLVRRSVRWRSVVRRSVRRHRLCSAEVELGGAWLRVSSLYVPPVAPGVELDLELLAAGLDGSLALLVGDLNARSTELGCRTTNAHGRRLAEFLLDDAAPVVSLREAEQPTLFHRSCGFVDTVDWALATPAAARFLSADLGTDVDSDHIPVVVRSLRPAAERRRFSDAARWRTSRVTDWRPFETAVEAELREAQLAPDPPFPSCPAEVDTVAETFEAALQRAADSCFQRSRPRADDARLPFPWWVVQLVRLRSKLRRRLAAHGPTEELRRELARVRRALRRALDDCRREAVLEKARAFTRGPRRQGLAFWSAVKHWFRGPDHQLPPLCGDVDVATSPAERAEVFVRHLERALGGEEHPSFDADFRHEVEAAVAADLDLQPLGSLPEEDEADEDDPARPVLRFEVARELRQLHSGKAPGPDGVSTDMLRHLPRVAVQLLARLFSSSLALGYVPGCWRRSYVRMLPKPGKQLSRPADFRPIALCSCVGKVLERLFARRLSRLLEARGLLPEEQSAFRPGRGTEEQLCLVAQRAVQASNGGLSTTLVALDVNKAYDSVWHAGLVRRLRTSTSVPTARWVAAFLRERRAAVLEDGCVSRFVATAAGVPQGSPLSPALFIFFTAEMPLPRGQLVGASLYADDLALWACADSPAAALDAVRPHLQRIERWGRLWRLRFNPDKTQLGFFSRRTRWPTADLQPQLLLGAHVDWADHVDLLGLRFDRRLQLLPHAQRLAERLGPRCLELRRWSWAFRTVPAWVGVLLYKTLIRPALTYGGAALLLSCATARERLRRLERRGLRAALRRGLDTPIERLYVEARCPELDAVLRTGARRQMRRAADTRNSRLLAGFVSGVAQRADRARRDLPLERAFALLDEDDEEAVRSALEECGVRRGAFDIFRPGRNRGVRPEVELWGRSPFAP